MIDRKVKTERIIPSASTPFGTGLFRAGISREHLENC